MSYFSIDFDAKPIQEVKPASAVCSSKGGEIGQDTGSRENLPSEPISLFDAMTVIGNRIKMREVRYE